LLDVTLRGGKVAKSIIPFRKLSGQPKPTTQSEAKEIAGEVLTVVRNCAQALQTYRNETEIAMGEISGLLDYLEIVALRGIAKGGTR
jgi:hypothetical protein